MRSAHPRKMGSPGEWWKSPLKRQISDGENFTSDCACANEAGISPSIFKEGHGIGVARRWRIPLNFSRSLLSLAIFLGGCGADAPKLRRKRNQARRACRTEDIQLAAKALLGSESQVLAFGDLAKNGKQEFPCGGCRAKDANNNLPGTIVTRVVVAEIPRAMGRKSCAAMNT